MNEKTKAQRLGELYKLVTGYTTEAHEKKLLPRDHSALAWFARFKYLNPTGWASSPEKIPYIAATALVDSYSCLPRRPDMAFTYAWTAINSCYNDLYMKLATDSESLGDSKAIERSLIEINKFMQAKIEWIAEDQEESFFTTPEEIALDFISRTPDKTLHFVASYILKGLAIERHNKQAKISGAEEIRAIHITSSYKSFKKNFKAMFNSFYWTYGKAYFDLCQIKETPDKTDVDFGITDSKQSRAITHALGLEIKHILTVLPLIDQFDDDGEAKKRTPALDSENQRMEFLIFSFLYATRNNNAHGNVASRINSIFSNSDTIAASTWTYLLGYFYLSLLLVALDTIDLDDLHIHSINACLSGSK